MEEVMALMRQMESIPDPPLSLRKIPEERRCSHCRALATSWTQSLVAKVASLPTRQLREDEYVEVLRVVCKEDTVQRERTWLCEHLLETVGENELWNIFQKFKDIPPEHLCSREARMCPRRRRDAPKCIGEAECKA
eukprot:symbB.v1.2.014412.t1/scaffold1000.1/size145704/3